MAFNGQFTTGLLGYSLRKEFLSEGFFYREIEVYDYAVYVSPNASEPFNSIQSGIKTQFLSLYSGDINIKIFDAPAGYTIPNDSIRLGRFDVQIEIRKPVLDLGAYMTELGDNYYKGFDSGFITSNCNILNDVKEQFDFEQGENGHKSYSHNLSFSIRNTGNGKAIASNIASGIFSNDKDTTFGIYAFTGGALVADTGVYKNYYSETYDLVRNTYNFTKKREISSSSASAYVYDLEHSLNLKEDGTISVLEKGEISSKLTFGQVNQGLIELLTESYNRCNVVYDKFKNFSAISSVSDLLINLPLTTNKTLNRGSLSAKYEIDYTNNPNYTTSGTTEKIIDINNDGKYVSIDHSYNFLLFVSPAYSGIDITYMPLIVSAVNESPAIISDVYTTGPFYNPNYPNMNRIRISSITPNRHKNFSASFGYTNRPTYFVTIDGYIYPFFECSLSDVKPIDKISEYKIINRPSKTSLMNYAYQTEKGTKNLSITAQLARGANIFNTPLPSATISPRLSSLYRYGLEKSLSAFFGLNVLALSYSLESVKYSLTSKNEIKLNISINYNLKKYTA